MVAVNEAFLREHEDLWKASDYATLSALTSYVMLTIPEQSGPLY